MGSFQDEQKTKVEAVKDLLDASSPQNSVNSKE